MSYDVVIVGAGPAGLACARVVAGSGCSVLVLERKHEVGPKICAGGITWNGLISKLNDISERSFRTQYIFSKKQQFSIREDDPIIATVNRRTLGQLMLQQAVDAGAEVWTRCQVVEIAGNTITMVNRESRTKKTIQFNHLIGADGSSSVVRKSLGLPVKDFGMGINYMVDGQFPKMEWHLDSSLFGCGYGWVFPHKNQASIGAYADSRSVSAKFLKQSLLRWAAQQNISLTGSRLTAERVNYDFRGYAFGNTYLVGDAAGLASPLTGEGIFPAIVSGEAVGRIVCGAKGDTEDMKKLINNHKKHKRVVGLARVHPGVSTMLSELLCIGLRTNLIDFRAAEMAN